MTQRASVILFAREPFRRPLKNAIAQIARPQLRPALGASVAGKGREPPSLQARARLACGCFQVASEGTQSLRWLVVLENRPRERGPR